MISAKNLRLPVALFCLAIFISAAAHAQTATKVSYAKYSSTEKSEARKFQPLSIGDKLPDVKFNEVVNYKTGKAKFSDFKGKLTILDFWSTACTSCISLFPHMQQLKDEFKGQLQIILVNGKTQLWQDNEAKAKRILERLKTYAGADIRLPIVMNCEELDDYFPWLKIPHEVWIDEDGTIIAITGGTEVTSSNIEAILEGKKIYMRTKNDLLFNPEKQTLAELINPSNELQKKLSSSVFIQGQIDGLGTQFVLRSADSPYSKLYSGFFITNTPLSEIYKSFYRDKMSLPNNQIFIESQDSLRFKPVNFNDTSVYSNVYSYDITVSPTSFDTLMIYGQNDLERTFHATVINEKRMVKCFVVRRTFQAKSCYSKGGNKEFVLDNISSKKYVRNYPLGSLLSELNNRYFDFPLIDETALTVNVDIDFPSELTRDNIIATLKNAGFDIREEQREIEAAVITNN